MLFNPYQFFKAEPKYNKLVGDDYLFVEFKCPIEAEEFTAWSECHYIIYVLNGKKKWRTATKIWSILPGESIFVQKGAYFNQLDLEEDFCVLMFFMTDDFIKKFIEDDFKKNPKALTPSIQNDPIRKIKVTKSLSVLYQSFFTYLDQEQQTPRKLVELKFRELLLNILSDLTNQAVKDFMLSLAAGQSSLPRIMEENFYYNLGLNEFAKICGRSLASFKRDFQKYYGTSPGKWLVERRLKYAQSLLLETDKTIQEICYESGFENSSHFTRKFRKSFGVAPSKFRKEKTELAG